MNKKAVDKWVAALRDPNTKQGFSQLGDPEDGMCCLGVACHVAVQEGIIPYFDPECGSLRFYSLVQNWLGLTSPIGSYGGGKSLIHDNDDRKLSFSEIADIIESNSEGLFV